VFERETVVLLGGTMVMMMNPEPWTQVREMMIMMVGTRMVTESLIRGKFLNRLMISVWMGWTVQMTKVKETGSGMDTI
jgi:hypothetical protein